MKSVKKYYISVIILLLCNIVVHQNVAAQNTLSPQEKQIISNFEKQAKNYSQFRERIEEQLPKLPTEASAEQIEAHIITFQKSVQSARSDAKQGAIFTPAAARLIRKVIRNEFKGKDLVELKQTVMEAETKGVPLKINLPYPDSKELVEMPPRLLLSLPQLPKQLRYRFVGRHLLLVDRENRLIVDYMANAL